MIWTVLARYDGAETESAAGTWYEGGRNWAMSAGISDGAAPDSSMTREQLATMLYRYAGEPSAAEDLSAYADADSVSAYASDAMAWCVENGVLTDTLSREGQTLVDQYRKLQYYYRRTFLYGS